LRKSEASLPGNDAASWVSWPEVSGISPAIQMKKETMNNRKRIRL
jgi:hypothetical protein